MIRRVSCDLIVNWSRFVPCDFNMLQSWVRRLTVGVNGMAVYLILALKSSFPLMSVSSSVNDQGPVYSNGVGSYPMKIPKSMDRKSVLFWIGQRLLIHITQQGCSGLSHLWRRLLMRKTQQGFIAALYRPPHDASFLCAVLFAVGGMQKCANSEVGRLMISYLPQVGFIHRELMHWTSNIATKGLIDVRDWSVCFWFVVDVVSHEHWHRGGIFACLIYRGQHIHTESLCPKYV